MFILETSGLRPRSHFKNMNYLNYVERSVCQRFLHPQLPPSSVLTVQSPYIYKT